MATYGFRASIVSRGNGASAVAKAAYNARDRLTNERDGITHDYTRAHGGEDLAFAGLYVPKDAPSWAHDRSGLWNHVEGAEKRRDAQLARNIQLDLPHELTEEQNRRLVQDFVRENFTRKGYAADVAIHRAGPQSDARNIHAHILVSLRTIDRDGFALTKDREQNRIAQMYTWRESWAHHLSRHLERHGFTLQAERMAHGHLPQAAQKERAEARGDYEFAAQKAAPAQVHMGKHATALERDGIDTAKGQLNREAASYHAAANDLQREENQLARVRQWQAERDQLAADRQAARALEENARAAELRRQRESREPERDDYDRDR